MLGQFFQKALFSSECSCMTVSLLSGTGIHFHKCICTILHFPPCVFSRVLEKKMYCQHWAHLFWVKITTVLCVIIFHDTVPYIDWIWRKNEWLIAFDLEIPTDLEFLVVFSSVLYQISQIKGSDFLLCDIIGPTPESCPVWGMAQNWKGPCRGQGDLQDTMGKRAWRSWVCLVGKEEAVRVL